LFYNVIIVIHKTLFFNALYVINTQFILDNQPPEKNIFITPCLFHLLDIFIDIDGNWSE